MGFGDDDFQVVAQKRFSARQAELNGAQLARLTQGASAIRRW